MTCHRKHSVIPALFVQQSAQSKVLRTMLQFYKIQLPKMKSFKNGASKAQSAKMQRNQASKSSSYTQDVSVSGQQYNDDSHTAPASTAPIGNFDKQGACVKNSKHIFEGQKCPPGG